MHIKRHYYDSHTALNPAGIVPLGPQLDFQSEPKRAAMTTTAAH
jgi:putative glutathione S-transferase